MPIDHTNQYHHRKADVDPRRVENHPTPISLEQDICATCASFHKGNRSEQRAKNSEDPGISIPGGATEHAIYASNRYRRFHHIEFIITGTYYQRYLQMCLLPLLSIWRKGSCHGGLQLPDRTSLLSSSSLCHLGVYRASCSESL